MLKDKYLKIVFIPLIGLLVPFYSGLVSFQQSTVWQDIFSSSIFLIASYLVWQGVLPLVRAVRKKPLATAPGLQLLPLALGSGLYGSLVFGLAAAAWMQFFTDFTSWQPVKGAAVLAFFSSMFVAMLYEVLFLLQERVVEERFVQELEKDRLQAEASVLNSELDPHFMFNSLTVLSQLVCSDASRAQSYIRKMAQVYKYFLINKGRELIPLDEELRFLENYYYLLKIRYDGEVRIVNNIATLNNKIMVVPCSLQVLVENAIKHNQFSQEQPLDICLSLDDKYVIVENELRRKPLMVESTKVGLENLQARYVIHAHQPIVVKKGRDRFVVKVPLVKPRTYG